jgi:hypothetical protein
MRSMAIDRRQFLLGSAATALLARPVRADAPIYAAACADDSGGYALRAFDGDGRMAWARPLPSRGHGIACHGGRLAAFARRPGSWAILMAARDGAAQTQIEAPDGLTFNGHGAFSADGRRLFATATREEDDSGWLVALDGDAGWRAAATWPTGGSDPHELLRIGDKLVVANGGLPDGRPARDPDEVDTSLAWLDIRTGELLRLQRPPEGLRRVSLRHMTAIGGRIFVVGQDQGSAKDRLPLLAMSDGRRLLHIATPPLDGYCGSVAASDGALCVTSPRAGRAYVLDEAGNVRSSCDMADVCGVAATADGGFLLTSGRGELRLARAAAAMATPGLRWDNHAAALSA